MHYIYHIPGVKIGCTKNIKQRMRVQGFTEWEILEEHEDGWLAGDREIELQKQYGYPVDNSHYMVSIKNLKPPSPETQLKIQESLNRNGTRTGGIPYIDKDTAFRISSSGGKATRSITMELANEIRSKYVKKYGMIAKLAKEYNINTTIVGRIVRNQIYLD
jgi:hypothetical protein